MAKPKKMTPEIIRDIANYKQLLERTDLVNDIPPRRTTVTKKPKATKPPATSQGGTATRKRLKPIKGGSQVLRRPTFTGQPQPEEQPTKAIASRSQTRSAQKKKQEIEFTRSKFKFRKTKTQLWNSVANASGEGRSFEYKILTDNTYEELIKIIRERAGDIDFGLLSGFLPKNLQLEKLRFHVEFEADRSQLYPRASVFSDNIDQFCKQLSNSVSQNDLQNISFV